MEGARPGFGEALGAGGATTVDLSSVRDPFAEAGVDVVPVFGAAAGLDPPERLPAPAEPEEPDEESVFEEPAVGGSIRSTS